MRILACVSYQLLRTESEEVQHLSHTRVLLRWDLSWRCVGTFFWLLSHPHLLLLPSRLSSPLQEAGTPGRGSRLHLNFRLQSWHETTIPSLLATVTVSEINVRQDPLTENLRPFAWVSPGLSLFPGSGVGEKLQPPP